MILDGSESDHPAENQATKNQTLVLRKKKTTVTAIGFYPYSL